MDKLRPSSLAWAGLIAGVCIYDYLAPPHETLSERVDSALENHPIVTVFAVGATALHLLNVLPPELDPIHRVAERFRNGE